MASRNENNPIASAKPAPMKADRSIKGPAEGFLAVAFNKAEKMFPTPIAAPSIPMAHNPTPMYFNVASSIF